MIRKILLVVAFAGLAQGCSQDAAKQVIENPKLIQMGTIQQEHTQPGAIRAIGGDSRESFQFSGNNVKHTIDLFAAGENKTPIVTIFYSGTYERGEDLGNDTYQINFSYDKAEMVARNATAVQFLNTMSFCGKNDFAVGKTVNMTADSSNELCPLEDMPSHVFDIYKVEGDRVFFGKGDKTSADKRPKDLDRDNPFVKR